MRISDWSSDVCSSDLSPLATPAAAAACSATGPALLPATSTCTSPPSLAAAAMAFRVAPFRWALSSSAITSVVILEHLPFVLELVDQRGHRSEERRVGKGCVRTCKYRGTRYNKK